MSQIAFNNLLPYFYIQQLDTLQTNIVLDENNSRHAIQVLRMKVGDSMQLTDGMGHLIFASITNDHKKHCEVRITKVEQIEKPTPTVTIAIALTKNTGRFEWFLEKAAELGVSRVVPLITKRSEKQKIKEDRLHNILVSAMLQSQQSWMLQLQAPIGFDELMRNQEYLAISNKFIAHCEKTDKKPLTFQQESSIAIIGPEGDFAQEEINDAIKSGFLPVTLGNTRLRTETAGMVAATLLRISR